MHKEDCYFANARFYNKDGVILGMYVLTEDCLSVFPKDGYKDLEVEVDVLFVKFFTFSGDTLDDPAYDYHEFINYVKDKSQEFDTNSVLIEPLSFEYIQEMKKHLKEVEF